MYTNHNLLNNPETTVFKSMNSSKHRCLMVKLKIKLVKVRKKTNKNSVQCNSLSRDFPTRQFRNPSMPGNYSGKDCSNSGLLRAITAVRQQPKVRTC